MVKAETFFQDTDFRFSGTEKMVADFPTKLSSSTTWLKEERRRKKRTKKVVSVVSCTSLRQRVGPSVGARVAPTMVIASLGY